MSSRPLIGIMQGRLSKPRKNRIQAFPRDTWEHEFDLARTIGLDLIEFVFDEEDAEHHPLMSDGGCGKIDRRMQDTGVHTRSVCADYFMFHPLHKGPPEARGRSMEILKRLIAHARTLGIRDIVLPCVDQGAVTTSEEERALKRSLADIHELLESCGIHLALESDFPPHTLKTFLDDMPLSHVTVNYDMGNSASLGYSAEEEMRCYGPRISSVHVKDRLLHGGTVPLGTGNTRFQLVFEQLRTVHYRGAFILQAARGPDEVEAARAQLQFVERLLEKHYGPGTEK